MKRASGQRAGLTHAAVVAGATRVLTASGIDGLTVRAVALELGVTPNAIYRWVSTKSELIDAVLDTILETVNMADDDREPIDQLLALVHDCFDTVNANPDLAGLFLDRRTAAGPNATAIRERIRHLVRQLGAGEQSAATAVPVLLVYAYGFGALVQQTSGGAQLLEGEHLGTPLDTFGVGLRWILRGMGVDIDLPLT